MRQASLPFYDLTRAIVPAENRKFKITLAVMPENLLFLTSAVNFARRKQENAVNTNLAHLPQDDMDKINVDLAAGAVAFKERYNMPVVAEQVEREQPEALRAWFRERLVAHRLASVNLSRLPYEPKSR